MVDPCDRRGRTVGVPYDRRGRSVGVDPYGPTPSIAGVTPTVRPLRSQGSTPTIEGVRPLRYRRGPIVGVDPSDQIGSRLLQAEQSAGDQRRVTSPTREALPPRCTAGRYLFFLSKGVMAAAKPPIGPNTGGCFLMGRKYHPLRWIDVAHHSNHAVPHSCGRPAEQSASSAESGGAQPTV